MQVADLMTHPAVTCHVNDTLHIAAKLMWDHGCGAIAVVRDEGQLAGMLTDRDVCMAAYTQGREPEAILVNGVITTHAISVRPDQDLAEAEALMAKHAVRRLPVVDDDGKPVGVISIDDLAVESVRPDTPMADGPARLARTLAAIVDPRARREHAA